MIGHVRSLVTYYTLICSLYQPQKKDVLGRTKEIDDRLCALSLISDFLFDVEWRIWFPFRHNETHFSRWWKSRKKQTKKKKKKKIDWKAVLFKKRNMGVFVYIFPDGCPFSFSFLLCLLIGAWRHWKEASPRRWLLWWEVVVLLRPIQSSLGRALKRNGSMMHDHFPPFFSFFGVPASNSNLKQSRKKRE